MIVLNWPECFNTRAVLILKLQYLIWLRNSFSAAGTGFESGFTENLGAAIINLALVGLLGNLGVQQIFGSFSFISVTSRLNLSFRNEVFSGTILSTLLVAFVHVDVMLLTLLKSLINI